MTIQGLGWLPQLPDHRDFKLGAPSPMLGVLFVPNPPSVDLRPKIDWIYNQGQENSCTAHCSASMDKFIRRMKKQPDFDASRAFQYWNTRNLEGTEHQDDGAYIRDAMKVLNTIGAVPEESWEYNASTLYAVPPQALYPTAEQNKITTYWQINQTRNDLQYCLAQGFPFVFGIEVFDAMDSYEVARTGIVPMPNSGDKVLGGHAIMCVGYDNSKQWYIIQNSWGKDWGDKGFFYLPYEFVETDCSSDFWTIR
jgi:C1A family cysteine protease